MIKFYKGLRDLYNLDLYGSGIYFATDTLEILHNGKSYSGVPDKVVKDIAWTEGSIIITYTDNTTTNLGGLDFDRVFTYKGSVSNFNSLPSNPKVGDVYNVESSFVVTSETILGDLITKEYPVGTNVAWNGEIWDPLAGFVDLSNYATKLELTDVQTQVSELHVKSVDPSDKILTLNSDGNLSTHITLSYDSETKCIQLKGNDEDVISELSIDLVPEIGQGLQEDSKMLSVKVDSNQNNKLTISEKGLLVDISNDLLQIVSTIDEKITTAFEWQDIN